MNRIRTNLFFTIISIFLLSTGCENDEDITYTAGEEFIEENNRLVFIDTLSIETSTIMLDSIETNNTAQILVGETMTEGLGSTEVSSYLNFHPGYIYSNDIDDLVYDSLVIVMNYSGYWFGDTTQQHEIYIHPLNETIEKDDEGYLYNVSSFEYQNDPVGHLSYFPTPQESEEMTIRMDDEMGTELFQMIKDDNDTLFNTILFEKKYPGFVILPGEDVSSVIGFNCSSADTSGVSLRLYYHDSEISIEEDEDEDELTYFNFGVGDVSDQFNRFKEDRTGTGLENLIGNSSGIPGAETSNVSYVQGGTPVLTLLKFPTADQLLYFGKNSTLLSAELKIEPIAGSYDDDHALPETLSLYVMNKKYSLIGQMTDLEGNSVTGQPVIDHEFDEESYYSFDITNYLYTDLNDELPSQDWIAIGLPWEKFQNSVDRACIGDHYHSPNKMKLLVYYIVY